MTARRFPRTEIRWLPLLAALFALPSMLALGARDASAERPLQSLTERRALWVVRDALLDPEGIGRMVADADRAGITDLIVQVRGRGDAWYRSDLVPVAPPLRDAWNLHGTYDPLELVLEKAHARGIRVHAWLNVYLVASWTTLPADHVTRRHPDWVATDARGVSMGEMSQAELQRGLCEGQYLDPGRGEVALHFVRIVRELVDRYPVDGIHLDYVRYPHMDVGYNDAMRLGFRRRAGVDPVELRANRAGLAQERGRDGLEALEREWREYRAEQVTALVARVREGIRLTRPGVVLSAAVKPDSEGALSTYGQDWVRWINEDLVDVVAPMMYSPSMRVVQAQVRSTASRVPPERVWAGIAVYNQSLRAAAEKIRAAEAAGLGGISIFSYNSLPGGGSNLMRLNHAR